MEAVPGRINMDLGQFSATGLVGPVRLTTRSRETTHSVSVVSRKSWMIGAPRMISADQMRVASGISRARSILAPI